MSTLRVDNLNARTGTKITVPTGTTFYTPGHVIQVVSTSSTSQMSTSSTNTITATGLIATLTPISSTSKILVRLSGGAQNYGATGVTLKTYFYRSIGGGAYSSLGMFERFVQGSSWGNPHSAEYLDSPATTSSVSYQPYYMFDTSNAGYFNDSNGVTVTLTLMEIGA